MNVDLILYSQRNIVDFVLTPRELQFDPECAISVVRLALLFMTLANTIQLCTMLNIDHIGS